MMYFWYFSYERTNERLNNSTKYVLIILIVVGPSALNSNIHIIQVLFSQGLHQTTYFRTVMRLLSGEEKIERETDSQSTTPWNKNNRSWHWQTYHVTGVSRRQAQHFKKILQMSKLLNLGLYLESSWEMHSNKYKYAWYFFINLWNRR